MYYLIIFYLILLIIFIICGIIILISQWKVLKKANQPAWSCLIPFYNIYILCKLSGLKTIWTIIYFLGIIVLYLIPKIGIFGLAFLIIYFNTILYVSIGKSFGKDSKFSISLTFLPIIFWPLISKNCNYVGPRPVDPLFHLIEDEQNNYNGVNQQQNTGMNNENNNN